MSMRCRRIEVRSVAATTRTKQRWYLCVVAGNNQVEYTSETYSSYAKALRKSIKDGFEFELPVWDRTNNKRYPTDIYTPDPPTAMDHPMWNQTGD